MSRFNSLACNAIFKSFEGKSYSTKDLYMKESNIFAGNSIIKQIERDILLNAKKQYMKEPNTHTVNATLNSYLRLELLNIKG